MNSQKIISSLYKISKPNPNIKSQKTINNFNNVSDLTNEINKICNFINLMSQMKITNKHSKDNHSKENY